MSDAPREEEIYQALSPGGQYKSGLVNPVAAQQDTTVSIPMRFKGAMGGGAVGNEDYPDHEPRSSVPYKHYKDLEDIDPKLHEAVTHVADEIHIPRTDLASLVYANSDYDPNTRKGMRTGYMGLTPDDARQLDPEGHLDINDPIDNLFMGAMKYKRISNRFGMGTPHAFAAYHGGGDRIQSLLGQDPDEHRRMAPDGTFDFLNKVLGRDEEPGGDVASMAAAAQAGQQPERFRPQRGAVPPMVPNDPGATAALTYGSLPSQVSPYRSYEGPPEAPRPAERDTYEGPPEGAPPRAAIPPYYPQEISRPQGAGAGRQAEPGQATLDRSGGVTTRWNPQPGATEEMLRDRERIDRATPVPPDFYSRGSQTPRQPNYNLDPNAPPPGPPADDTGWQRPIPPAAPPPDDTGWQRPVPPGPPPIWTLPDGGGYAVGGAIGNRVAEVASQPAVPPDQAAAPPTTTGSGAPPSPAAPARQQAIGTDNSAAELNRQELARVTGATPTTGSGGPTPTTVPSAGGDTGPAANLPTGAPKALAPPGSTPTTTAAPPIDRLNGNGGAMTPASAVRAGAQGPDGVLTHIARNGPRGMSIGDGWDHFQDLLERAMIMKGDINGLQHAQEYVFRMKHKGAMENMMQAIASMDDPETAVRFLAKSHAFVTDGTAIGFQVLNNQIFGQKYDEQTHDKIGKPFQVTEEGLRKLALAYSPPDKFSAALNQERTTNETGRHNRKQETHADEQLQQEERKSLRALEEKKIEFDITQQRLADQAAQRKHEQEQQDKRARDLADQQERVRKETQAAQHAQQTAEKEKDRQLREDQNAQRAAENAEKAAAKAADEKASHAKYADDATDEYFGRGGMAGAATDHNNQPYKGPDLTKARVIFGGMLHHDRTVQSPETAMDYTRGFLSGKYKMAESVGDDGKRYAHIRDEEGNVLATVPSNIWRMYLPKQGTVKR